MHGWGWLANERLNSCRTVTSCTDQPPYLNSGVCRIKVGKTLFGLGPSLDLNFFHGSRFFSPSGP